MVLFFPIFLKKYEYNNGDQDDIFSSFGPTYQSRIRYLRDSGSNPSNLTPLFQNEWDFLAFFGPLVHKGEERERDGLGTLKSEMDQYYGKPQ